MRDRLLVCTDLSEGSVPVLEYAERLAGRLGAKVWLLHVAAPEPDFIGYDPGPPAVRDQVARTLRREHQETQRHAERLAQRGLEATPLVVQGPTVDRILEHAERLDVFLILLGSGRHGMLYELVVGSVASGVLQRATRPVLIVPSPSP